MEWNEYHRIQMSAAARGASPKDTHALLRNAQQLGAAFPSVCVGSATFESLCSFLWFQLRESGAHRVGEATHCFAFKTCEQVVGGTTEVQSSHHCTFKISSTMWKRAVKSLASKPSDSWRFLAGAFSSDRATLVLHQGSSDVSIFFHDKDFARITLLIGHMEHTRVPFLYTDNSVLITEKNAACRFLLGVQTMILCPAKREIALCLTTCCPVETVVQRSKELGVALGMMC